MHACIHTYIDRYMYRDVCIYIYIYMCIHTYTCIYVPASEINTHPTCGQRRRHLRLRSCTWTC